MQILKISYDENIKILEIQNFENRSQQAQTSKTWNFKNSRRCTNSCFLKIHVLDISSHEDPRFWKSSILPIANVENSDKFRVSRISNIQQPEYCTCKSELNHCEWIIRHGHPKHPEHPKHPKHLFQNSSLFQAVLDRLVVCE